METTLTAEDIKLLEASLTTIATQARSARRALEGIFKLDFNASKISSSIESLTGKITTLADRTRALAESAELASKAYSSMKIPRMPAGSGTGKGGGGKATGGGGGSEDSGAEAELKRMLAFRRNLVRQKTRELRENAKFYSDWQGRSWNASREEAFDEAKRKARQREAAEKRQAAAEKRFYEQLRPDSRQFGGGMERDRFVKRIIQYYGLDGSYFRGILKRINLGGAVGGGPGGALVSKFGNPGQMPLVTRFRVFQRPFPGSERNPFSLGDSGNVLNNAVVTTGRLVEMTFRGIVEAGAASVQTLGSMAGAAFQVASVMSRWIGQFLPILGARIAGVISSGLELVGTAVKALSESIAGVMSALGEFAGGLIQSLTTLGLAISGVASRAVIAASNITELQNAAMITTGRIGSERLTQTARQYQADYGLSATDSLRMMSRVAQQVRNLTGSSGDDAAKAAEGVFTRVAEAGSVLNMNLDDMSKTIQSALAGRYTPLRRIGVAVSADMLDDIARARGYDKGAKSRFEPRLRALLDEIRRQTEPFVGDLAATRFEFANQNRKFLGLFEAIFIEAGRILEPFAKAVLYVSNEAMSRFRGFLKTFADSMQKAVDRYNINRDPASRDFVQPRNQVTGPLVYVEAFVRRMAVAGNYTVAFGQYLWESRQTIAVWVESISQALARTAAELVRLSSVFLGWFTEVMPPVISAMLAFKESLVTVVDWINRRLGTDPKSKAKEAYDRDLAAIFETRAAQEKLNGYFFSNAGRRAAEREASILAYRSQAASDRLQKYQSLRTAGKNEDDARQAIYGTSFQMNDVLPGWNPQKAVGKLNDLAVMLQQAATDPAALASRVRLPQVPAIFNPDQIMSDINGRVGRLARFLSMEEPQEKTGALSRYFTPQAFYDEVAGRDVSPMETVAENTGNIRDSLDEILRFIENRLGSPQPATPFYPTPILGE